MKLCSPLCVVVVLCKKNEKPQTKKKKKKKKKKKPPKKKKKKKKKEKRFSSFSLEGEKTNHTTKEEEERSFAQKFCLLYSIHFAFVCFLSHRRRRRRQMEEFNDPRFDPIHYVNVAARQCFNNDEKKKHLQHKANDITDENVELERLLSELEMRLQLLGRTFRHNWNANRNSG